MTDVDFAPLVRAGLDRAGAHVEAATIDRLARYLSLLRRWNRKINLTAFDLDEPTDHAIDRLVVEAVVAAGEVLATDRVAVDVGSGGGSPALPLKIARPDLAMTLVESRVRKSAFLREAIRDLDLAGVAVETTRLDRDGLARLNGTADVVTMRAVRGDADTLAGVRALLAPTGRLFWFRDDGDVAVETPGWSWLRPNASLQVGKYVG